MSNYIPLVVGGVIGLGAIAYFEKSESQGFEKWESKEMKYKRIQHEEYLKFKEYTDILESGDTNKFNRSVSQIKD